MASSTLFKKSSFSTVKSAALGAARFAGSRTFASVSVGTDLVSVAPDVSLQKARTWDEGVSSKFSTTPLKDIFKDKKVVIFGLPGAFTGVCSTQHVPSYKNYIDKFKARGIDSVICVAVNDPYVMNGRHGSTTASQQMTIFYAGQAHFFMKSTQIRPFFKLGWGEMWMAWTSIFISNLCSSYDSFKLTSI